MWFVLRETIPWSPESPILAPLQNHQPPPPSLFRLRGRAKVAPASFVVEQNGARQTEVVRPRRVFPACLAEVVGDQRVRGLTLWGPRGTVGRDEDDQRAAGGDGDAALGSPFPPAHKLLRLRPRRAVIEGGTLGTETVPRHVLVPATCHRRSVGPGGGRGFQSDLGAGRGAGGRGPSSPASDAHE